MSGGPRFCAAGPQELPDNLVEGTKFIRPE